MKAYREAVSLEGRIDPTVTHRARIAPWTERCDQLLVRRAVETQRGRKAQDRAMGTGAGGREARRRDVELHPRAQGRIGGKLERRVEQPPRTAPVRTGHRDEGVKGLDGILQSERPRDGAVHVAE